MRPARPLGRARSGSRPAPPLLSARFDGYLATDPSRAQALLDLERLADCLSYYAGGDHDLGSRASIALSDVLGWKGRG